MEDAATAEISRSQLWQWRTAGVTLEDGSMFDADRYTSIRGQELTALEGAVEGVAGGSIHLGAAADLLDRLVLDDDFAEFLTLGAYNLLD